MSRKLCALHDVWFWIFEHRLYNMSTHDTSGLKECSTSWLARFVFWHALTCIGHGSTNTWHARLFEEPWGYRYHFSAVIKKIMTFRTSCMSVCMYVNCGTCYELQSSALVRVRRNKETVQDGLALVIGTWTWGLTTSLKLYNYSRTKGLYYSDPLLYCGRVVSCKPVLIVPGWAERDEKLMVIS